eukprot:scaffold70374_cov26-Tisochrysis_lutea.AAC.1
MVKQLDPYGIVRQGARVWGCGGGGGWVVRLREQVAGALNRAPVVPDCGDSGNASSASAVLAALRCAIGAVLAVCVSLTVCAYVCVRARMCCFPHQSCSVAPCSVQISSLCVTSSASVMLCCIVPCAMWAFLGGCIISISLALLHHAVCNVSLSVRASAASVVL